MPLTPHRCQTVIEAQGGWSKSIRLGVSGVISWKVGKRRTLDPLTISVGVKTAVALTELCVKTTRFWQCADKVHGNVREPSIRDWQRVKETERGLRGGLIVDASGAGFDVFVDVFG
jgi:hypothetical protein